MPYVIAYWRCDDGRDDGSKSGQPSKHFAAQLRADKGKKNVVLFLFDLLNLAILLPVTAITLRTTHERAVYI